MLRLFLILPLLLSSGSAIPKQKTELFCVSAGWRLVCCKKWGMDGKLTECNNNVSYIYKATNIIIYE